MRQEEKRLKAKQKLLKATLDLIHELPFEKITIRKIAEKAGLTTGAVYHYYSSKEEIIYDSFSGLEELYEYLHLPSKESLQESLLSILTVQIKIYEDLGWERTSIYFKTLLLNINIEEKGIGYRNILVKYITEHEAYSKEQAQVIASSLIELVLGQTFYWCLCKGNFSLETKIKNKLVPFLNEQILPTTK
ncbi:TetR/AcrR family transcriptional regulator [Carnobacterium maltaromaticum]|uniref:TetR/AcrR family transcriptional regulator n=1 Tax=Carnobacterium maltaromaticum TaxID=2751 RepID=UPI0039BDCC56